MEGQVENKNGYISHAQGQWYHTECGHRAESLLTLKQGHHTSGTSIIVTHLQFGNSCNLPVSISYATSFTILVFLTQLCFDQIAKECFIYICTYKCVGSTAIAKPFLIFVDTIYLGLLPCTHMH